MLGDDGRCGYVVGTVHRWQKVGVLWFESNWRLLSYYHCSECQAEASAANQNHGAYVLLSLSMFLLLSCTARGPGIWPAPLSIRTASYCLQVVLMWKAGATIHAYCLVPLPDGPGISACITIHAY